MKVISTEQLSSLMESIILDKEQQAKVIPGQKFRGISSGDLFQQIREKLGTDWAVRKVNIKLTKEDLNSVANSRFYRKTGLKLLMIVAIVMLGLATLTATFHFIPPVVYYVLCGLAAIAFVFVFSKKQSEARRELWKGFLGENDEPEKDK